MTTYSVEVLRQVSEGTLAIEDAERLLASTETSAQVQLSPTPASTGNASQPFAQAVGCWAHAWLLLLLAGSVILGLSALWMNWAIQNARGFWTVCAAFPLILGVLLLLIGGWSRGAHWAHIRIHTEDAKKIFLSAPIPFTLLGWLLRIFGPLIPRYREQKLEFVPDILREVARLRESISVEVNEKDGTRVLVWIT